MPRCGSAIGQVEMADGPRSLQPIPLIESPLFCRRYGDRGPSVYLLHGGPGAPGYLALVARQLSAFARVIEPFQRRSGAKPLTVAAHIFDLHALVSAEASEASPILIGHSWGAMLALCFAAQHPGVAASLVLIGCGTFDPASRERLMQLREERMTPAMHERKARFLKRFTAPNARLRALGSFYQRLDSVDPIPHRDETAEFDARGHDESWADMLRLQKEGVYPAAFSRVTSPVLMLHGAQDPHPGTMIRGSLSPHVPQIQYVELPNCGHYPWLERIARDEFFARLTAWIRTS